MTEEIKKAIYSYNIETGDYKRITDQDYMEEWYPEF